MLPPPQSWRVLAVLQWTLGFDRLIAVKDVLVASRKCGAVMVLLTLAAVAAGTAGAGVTWSRCLFDTSCFEAV